MKHVFPVTKSHMLGATETPIWQNYVNSGKPLPPRVNNRALYGAIENQLQLGACTAFASTQWRVALRVLAGFPQQELSELADYYEERVLNGTVDSDSGATIQEAVQVLEQFGGMDESYDLYDPQFYLQNYKNAPPDKWDPALKLNPNQTFYIQGPNINDVKDALAQGMPVFMGFDCYAEIEGGVAANTGWLMMPADPKSSIGGHAVNVIGYDDDLQAFLILNQWGSQWGIKSPAELNGCFWMPYTYFEQYAFDVVAGIPDNGAPLKPQPIPAPFQKPVIDSLDVSIAFDKTTAQVGDSATATVKLTKNGQPFSGQMVAFQINLDNGPELMEQSFTTDENGQFTYTYKFDVPHKCVATIHYFTPYGDVIVKSSECDCVSPQPTPQPAPTKLYHVQVGAFSVKANADAMLAKLKAAGFQGFIKYE